MKCPRCQNEINDDSKFCPHCGHRIVRKEDQVAREIKAIKLAQTSLILNRILNIATIAAIVFVIIGLLGPILSTEVGEVGGLSWFTYEGWMLLNEGRITVGPFYTTFVLYLITLASVITLSSLGISKAINSLRKRDECRTIPHIIGLSIIHKVYSAFIYNFYYESVRLPSSSFATGSAWGETTYTVTLPIFTIALIVFLVLKTVYTGTTKKIVSHIFMLATSFLALNTFSSLFNILGFQDIHFTQNETYGTLHYFEMFTNLPPHLSAIIIALFILGIIGMISSIIYAIGNIRSLVKYNKINRKNALIWSIIYSSSVIIIFALVMVFGFKLNDISGSYQYIPYLSSELLSIFLSSFFILGLTIASFALNADKEDEIDDGIIDQEVIEKEDTEA